MNIPITSTITNTSGKYLLVGNASKIIGVYESDTLPAGVEIDTTGFLWSVTITL